MAKNKKTPPADAPSATARKSRAVKPDAAPDAHPLENAEGRAWLEDELRSAEFEVKNGPDGGGWQYNETLRPGIVQHAAFLRVLVDLVDKTLAPAPPPDETPAA